MSTLVKERGFFCLLSNTPQSEPCALADIRALELRARDLNSRDVPQRALYPLYAAGGQLRREGAARVLPPRDGCVDLVPVIIEFLHQNAVRPRPAEISS